MNTVWFYLSPSQLAQSEQSSSHFGFCLWGRCPGFVCFLLINILKVIKKKKFLKKSTRTMTPSRMVSIYKVFNPFSKVKKRSMDLKDQWAWKLPEEGNCCCELIDMEVFFFTPNALSNIFDWLRQIIFPNSRTFFFFFWRNSRSESWITPWVVKIHYSIAPLRIIVPTAGSTLINNRVNYANFFSNLFKHYWVDLSNFCRNDTPLEVVINFIDKSMHEFLYKIYY